MKYPFDRLAPYYHFLETLCFGNLLQRSRIHFVDTLDVRTSNVLILGDGNGRFASSLLNHLPEAQVDSIDFSQGMLDCAKKRIRREHPDKLHQYQAIHADALHCNYQKNHYDLIALNYFLDCLDSDQANRLLELVVLSLKNHGKVIHTDFAIPSNQPRKLIGQFLTKGLYKAFKLTAGVQVNQLPKVNWPISLETREQKSWLSGLIVSEIYNKRERSNTSSDLSRQAS